MPTKLPALPQWIGPDANGYWGHPMAPRVLWRLHAEPLPAPPNGGDVSFMWTWQWWSKKLGAWVNRFHWGIPGKWFPTPLSGTKFGIIPPAIYPPIAPPQLGPPPIALPQGPYPVRW